VTLNYGLRYEYFTPMQDKANLMTNIDPATGTILTSTAVGSIYTGTDSSGSQQRRAPDWRRLESFIDARRPRRLRHLLSGVRRYGSESQLALNPPQLIDVSLVANSGNDAPPMILRKRLRAGVGRQCGQDAPSSGGIQDPNQKTPWVHQFSVGPEYQIGASTVVGVEYVGNLTRNGRASWQSESGDHHAAEHGRLPVRAVRPSRTPISSRIATGRRGELSLAADDGCSAALSPRLAFTTSFTYGRALGNFLDHLSADGGGESGNFPKNVYDLAADYGPLSIDIRKRFVTSFIYELRWGRVARSSRTASRARWPAAGT